MTGRFNAPQSLPKIHPCEFMFQSGPAYQCHWTAWWIIGSAHLDRSVFACPTHLDALANDLAMASGQPLQVERLK